MTSGRNFDTAGLLATVLVITLLGSRWMGVGRRSRIDSRLARSPMKRLSQSTPLVKLAGGRLVLGAWESCAALRARLRGAAQRDRAGVPPGAGQRRDARAAASRSTRSSRGSHRGRLWPG